MLDLTVPSFWYRSYPWLLFSSILPKSILSMFGLPASENMHKLPNVVHMLRLPYDLVYNYHVVKPGLW